MILNVYTVIILFASALTGILALPVWFMSYRMYDTLRRPINVEAKTVIEDRSYLLLLTATVILIIKLLSWPFFYVTLQSYVPEIRGAMCIFGVTRFDPAMSNGLQLFKPLVFFLIGGWLLLNQIDRSTETSPLFRRKLLFLHIVSFMVIADSVGDLIYFTGLNTRGAVSCCTTFFDLPERATALLPLSILGAEYEKHMLPAYYISNAILIVFMGVSYRSFGNITSGRNKIMSVTVSGAILSALTAAITILAMFEVIAPRLMKLPYHHCIYCMWQYVPDSVLITAFFIVGIFAPCWALLLAMFGKHRETDATLGKYIINLYFSGAVSLSTSMLMVTLHLMLK